MSKNNLPEEVFSDTENAETYEQLDLSELIYGMPMGDAERGAGNPVQRNVSGVQTGLQAEFSLSGSRMPEIQSEKKQEEKVSLQR